MEQSCKNCEKPLPEKAKFCAYCGQKTSTPKVTVKNLLQKLWDTTFHVDNKLFRAFRTMLTPGAMARNYFEGKRSRYPHPIRLFLIAAFLFLFLLNKWMQNNQGGGIVRFNVDDNEYLDGVSFYEIMRSYVLLNDLREIRDTLYPDTTGSTLHPGMDSILNTYMKAKLNVETGAELFRDSTGKPDTSTINLLFTTMRIPMLDFVRYSPEELIEAYHINNYFEQKTLRQAIKSLKESETFGHAYVGSLSWVLLTIIVVMAGFLTLLYRKQKRFYVEHFVFLLYQHAGILFFFSILLLFALWQKPPQFVVAASIFLVALSQWLGMKRFYSQRWFTTTMKWSVYNLVYFIASALLFIIGTIIVFLLF